jgi:hypothetical protein
MTYISRTKIGDNFFFGGPHKPAYGISTAGHNVEFGLITIPNIGGFLKMVYVDIIIRRITNTNANGNWIAACHVKAGRAGTYPICSSLADGSLWVPGNSTVYGGTFYGENDVKAGFALGQQSTIYMENVTTDKDAMVLDDFQAIVRVVMG